jgi:hypothetical protein
VYPSDKPNKLSVVDESIDLLKAKIPTTDNADIGIAVWNINDLKNSDAFADKIIENNKSNK